MAIHIFSWTAMFGFPRLKTDGSPDGAAPYPTNRGSPLKGIHPGRAGKRRGVLRRTAGSLVLAVLAGVLAAYPAAAEDTTDGTVVPLSRSFRQQAVDLWESGGSEVRSAAETALVGSPDAIAAFLASYGDQEFQDYRVEAAQLAAMGGENTLEAARTALKPAARPTSSPS